MEFLRGMQGDQLLLTQFNVSFLIHGVPNEQQNEFVELTVQNLFSQRLEIQSIPSISNCFINVTDRWSKKKQRSYSILVTLASESAISRVLKNFRKLKGSGISIYTVLLNLWESSLARARNTKG